MGWGGFNVVFMRPNPDTSGAMLDIILLLFFCVFTDKRLLKYVYNYLCVVFYTNDVPLYSAYYDNVIPAPVISETLCLTHTHTHT